MFQQYKQILSRMCMCCHGQNLSKWLATTSMTIHAIKYYFTIHAFGSHPLFFRLVVPTYGTVLLQQSATLTVIQHLDELWSHIYSGVLLLHNFLSYLLNIFYEYFMNILVPVTPPLIICFSFLLYTSKPSQSIYQTMSTTVCSCSSCCRTTSILVLPLF